MKSQKKGILISNLGSPDAPTPESVKPYLDEFLMDPYVIDLPYLLRALVVRGIILRTRPKKSAEAYQTIWTPEGSPLVVYTRNLTHKIQKILGEEYSVKFAMRYGNPSFQSVLDEFLSEGITEVSVLPLYPQWALASTGSTVAHLKELRHPCRIKEVLNPFYADKDFVALIESRVRGSFETLTLSGPKTHYLFSFHGIPERHIRKSPGGKACPIAPDASCCLGPNPRKFCYRSHSYRTAHAVAERLGLKKDDFSVSFQSRLGIDQWLLPFTDVVVKELPSRGVERLVMLSPAFTADCLETIEELGDRAKHDFLGAGGKDFVLVPSLNDGDDWAEVLSRWVPESGRYSAFEKALV